MNAEFRLLYRDYVIEQDLFISVLNVNITMSKCLRLNSASVYPVTYVQIY